MHWIQGQLAQVAFCLSKQGVGSSGLLLVLKVFLLAHEVVKFSWAWNTESHFLCGCHLGPSSSRNYPSLHALWPFIALPPHDSLLSQSQRKALSSSKLESCIATVEISSSWHCHSWLKVDDRLSLPFPGTVHTGDGSGVCTLWWENDV